jgi:tetratricopeptide (TPR) repeat protein
MAVKVGSYYTKGGKMSSQAVERQLERAQQMFDIEDYSSAAHAVTHAIHLEPNNHRLYYLRAQCLVNEAFAVLEQDNSQLAIKLADDACSDMDKAIKLDRKNGEYYSYRGNIHNFRRRNTEALRDYQEAEKNGFEVNPEAKEAARRDKLQKVAGWGALAAMIIGGTVGKMAKDSWDEYGPR